MDNLKNNNTYNTFIIIKKNQFKNKKKAVKTKNQ